MIMIVSITDSNIKDSDFISNGFINDSNIDIDSNTNSSNLK